MKKIINIFIIIILLISISGCNVVLDEQDEQYQIYKLAQEAGFKGSYEEWLLSIKGEDGVGIESIEKTSTDGLIDTYTVLLNNGESTTFTVTNGKDGIQGASGKDGSIWLFGESLSNIEGNNGDFYLDTKTYDIFTMIENEWVLLGNLKQSDGNCKNIDLNDHYMINDGLVDMAANAVELVVDDKTGIAYACYLSSETTLGESSSLVKVAKFNILQPTNIKWVTVFDKEKDFSNHNLSECNIINLNDSIIRVFAVDLQTQQYYYKDVNKKTLTVSNIKEVKLKLNDDSEEVNFNTTNINEIIHTNQGQQFNYLQFTSKIIKVDNYYYTTVCGGNAKTNFLFMKSHDGSVWEFCSLVKQNVSYEAMLEYYDGKFWVMCRNGNTVPSNEKQQNLLYSEDGYTWIQSDLSLETSDTRPYLFTYQGELCLAYSSPLEPGYSTVRNWRCNIHVGKIKSVNGEEQFEELIYKESKFGIVYFALTDWYGKMIMLYSSGEIHPTEGLMGGWSQGKDCINYTILHSQEPQLSFRTLSNISITQMPDILSYKVGDIIDLTGLIIEGKYTNNTTSLISNYTVSDVDMTTPGLKTVTLVYTEQSVTKTVSFEINVVDEDKVLDSIEVVSLPNKTTYFLDEMYSDSGLVIKANYNIGSPKIIKDYISSIPDMSLIGKQEIEIKYCEDDIEKIVTFEIEIIDNNKTYTELPSIKSTNEQYIKTNLTTTYDTQIIIKMLKPTNDDMIDENGRWLFGSGRRNFGLCIKPDGNYVLDVGGTRYNTGTINWQEGLNTLVIGNGVYTINGNKLCDEIEVITKPTPATDFRILGNPASSFNTYFGATIFEILIYDGDELVMHLLPAKHIEDNLIGFYDSISNTMVYSATSKSFYEGSILDEE